MSRDGVILLMYDLSMKTKEEVHYYNIFRKNIIKNGFVFLQESVYYRYIRYTNMSNYVIKNVLSKVSRNANIRFIIMTVLQFERMNRYSLTKIDLSSYRKDIIII